MKLSENKISKIRHIYLNLALVIGFVLLLISVQVKNLLINLPSNWRA